MDERKQKNIAKWNILNSCFLCSFLFEFQKKSAVPDIEEYDYTEYFLNMDFS